MSKMKWILIGGAASAAIIGFTIALLVPGNKGEASSHSGSFVAIYLPCMVAIILSMRARRKREESKRNG